MAETKWIPGMQVRHGNMAWRRIEWGWLNVTPRPKYPPFDDCGERVTGFDAELTAALAAGPDLTDFATAAVYAAQRGWSVEHLGDAAALCHVPGLGRFDADTLLESVQAAAKAEGERA